MAPGSLVYGLTDLLQAAFPHRHQHPPLVPEVEADLVVGLEGGQQFVKGVVQVWLFACSNWCWLPGVQPGFLEENKPDVHPGRLGGGGEEDVDDPEGGDVSLAGHGCLDGVLGGQQTELDQLAVTDLESSVRGLDLIFHIWPTTYIRKGLQTFFLIEN